MDIKDVLLTREEWRKSYEYGYQYGRRHKVGSGGCYHQANTTIAKAQCLKLLKVLEDEGKIAHEISHLNGECWPDCWLCALKKMLEG
jgi:hypothetical protein